MLQNRCCAGEATHTSMAPAEWSTLPRIHQRIWTAIDHGMEKKIMAESEEKLLFQNGKPSCVPEWTPLAAMEEERQIKCRCVLKKPKPNNKSIDRKPLKVKQQKQQQQQQKKHPKVLSLSLAIPVELFCRLRRALGFLSVCLFF